MGIINDAAELLKIAMKIAYERNIEISEIKDPSHSEDVKRIWIDANKEFNVAHN